MIDINYFSVIVATLASFIFGAVWYSPLLFFKRWALEANIDTEQSVENPIKVYGLTFILTLLSVLAMAIVLENSPYLQSSVLLSGLVGCCIVATSLGINYQFSQLSLVQWMIDSGFHIGRFLLIGLVLGLWY